MNKWKEQFYPELPHSGMSKWEAIEHSYRKWFGLRYRTGINIKGRLLTFPDGDTLVIDSSSCALCKIQRDDCHGCPIDPCQGTPYLAWLNHLNPNPMITKLFTVRHPWMQVFMPLYPYPGCDALVMSLLKWNGIRLIKEYGIHKIDHTLYVGDEKLIEINYSNCALCSIHDSDCEECCINGCGESEFEIWVKTDNPEPMIARLQEAYERLH